MRRILKSLKKQDPLIEKLVGFFCLLDNLIAK